VSENGYKQLAALTERLKDVHIDAIYSSPLERAMETARFINKHHGLPVTEERDLMELKGGVWEGEQIDSMEEKYPEDFAHWNHSPSEFCPSGSEGMRSVYDRMSRCAVRIADENRGKTVVIVSHGCAIRNLVCWAKGYSIERLNDINWCGNTGITVIDFDENLLPEILIEGDKTHLSDDETKELVHIL
jgi:broad specificity phosphatase PhoE